MKSQKVWVRSVALVVGLLAVAATGTACTVETVNPNANQKPSNGTASATEGEEPGEAQPGAEEGVVGGWAAKATTCKSGAVAKYAYFLCANGRIRGAGEFKSGGYLVRETVCGSYTTSEPVYSNCDDKFGCFPKVTASITSTIAIGSEKDTESTKREFVYAKGDLLKPIPCDDGSAGMLALGRVEGEVTNADCECP
jgi:hypothetical protein